jgi:hypothetical protein
MTIKFMDVFHNAQRAVVVPMHKYLNDRIAPFLEEPGVEKVLLLETVYSRNYRLLCVNRAIRKYFKTRGIHCKNMSPRQKPGVTSSKDTERKAQALVSARAVLAEQAHVWLHHFENGLGNRVHDVADALLMVEYVRLRHGTPIAKDPTRSQVLQRLTIDTIRQPWLCQGPLIYQGDM